MCQWWAQLQCLCNLLFFQHCSWLTPCAINFHSPYETHRVGWNCILLCKESTSREKGKRARRIYLPQSLMTWLKWESDPTEKQSGSFSSLTFFCIIYLVLFTCTNEECFFEHHLLLMLLRLRAIIWIKESETTQKEMKEFEHRQKSSFLDRDASKDYTISLA